MPSIALPGTTENDNSRTGQAFFDGILLACLSFGALMMLYVQLVQVLRGRPKRDRIFWGIVVYSSVMFLLATMAIIGGIRLAELIYVTHQLSIPDAQPQAARLSLWPNVMGQASSTLLPWFGDILMLYRLLVFWKHQRWIIIFPGLLYLAHVSISVPLLISQTQLKYNMTWQHPYKIAFYSLCVSLNVVFTSLVCVRILMIRSKAEKVLGKLQASFYNSSLTLFVESGAFFTIWSVVYLITLLTDSWVKYIFLLPYPYIFAITRILIIMRMARNRAWSKDIITAAIDGELEWQISSRSSMPLRNVPEFAGPHQNSPQKSIDDESDQ
ncbi:hypothetical protein BYT27DRAFT_7127882 [Phlegmacium glaucopus]|nr:hypothetical protein BYT27DRAFT_7127882 [Phlegmacium glaucopus]